MALPSKWDLDVDVAVLGTGAAALTAAMLASDGGAKTVIIEKSEKVGGTSALSGGVLWVPNNHHMAEVGIPDSREDALTYLRSLSLGRMDQDMVETFVDTGPEMVKYMEEHTPARFITLEKYPDYHPEHPCGKPGGGRSLDNALFSFKRLGEWADKVNRSVANPFPATMQETSSSGGAVRLDYALMARRLEQDMRSTGNALVGSLLRGCLDRAIPIHMATRARDLVIQDGAVVGVRAEQNGRDFFVRTRRAVIIGTGGFEWNDELVKAFLRGPMDGPCTPPENEGDGLLMAMSIGAALGNMSEAWWMPSIRIPGEELRGKPVYRLCLMERTCPGSIIVNRKGKRFVDEAVNYNDIGRAFHTFDPTSFEFPNLPAYLIFDQVYKNKYVVAGSMPDADAPTWMPRGSSLRELASQIGVDADGLESTVARFNQFALKGEDPDFHRGESVYDNYNGDKSLPKPFSTLGTIEAAPFYAVEIHSGTLGTKGGPKTNPKAQVLNTKGEVIPGLYAVGNAMSAATGLVYGGAGGTLGPGMTYGYIAGRNAAQEPVKNI